MNVVVKLAHELEALEDVTAYVKNIVAFTDNIRSDIDSAVVHLMQKDREQCLFLHGC